MSLPVDTMNVSQSELTDFIRLSKFSTPQHMEPKFSFFSLTILSAVMLNPLNAPLPSREEADRRPIGINIMKCDKIIPYFIKLGISHLFRQHLRP